MKDDDIKKDWQECYKEAAAYWGPYLEEAQTDLQFALGKQWDSATESYLLNNGRSAFVFNKIRRINKLISGHQIKNRLALKINPVEGSDDQTADQFSGVIQWQMQAGSGYNVMSDAFLHGPLITGSNLVELYMDYNLDPLNGDICFARVPYNRFLLDPNFSSPDFRDLGYLIRREYKTKDAAKLLLPGDDKKEIDALETSYGVDDKFPYYQPSYRDRRESLVAYDEYWRTDYFEVTIIIDPKSYQFKEWKGDKKRLKEFMQINPGLRVLRSIKRTVELHVFVDSILMYSGPGPTGIDDYPFVWLYGDYTPEEDLAEYKLQGLDRCIRDPQTELNKRRSKMVDIIDSQINSGWKAKEGAVSNVQQLFQSGQGVPVFIKEDHEMTDLERLSAPDIPAGIFQLNELFDRDIEEIPGANSEMFGMPENGDIQIAGVLAKLRSGAGLTVLQDIFDKYRFAKKLLGQKLVKVIQKNYTPDKIRRIINKQPSKEFYDRKFGRYDCMPTEGVFTDSQRQMSYAQLLAMKMQGAPVPWTALLDAAPLENKEEVKKFVQQAEQQQAQQGQQAQQFQQLQVQMMMAKIQSDLAGAQEKRTQSEENRTNAFLDRARTVKELRGIDLDQVIKVIEFMRQMSEGQQLGGASMQGQMPGLPGPRPGPPMMPGQNQMPGQMRGAF